MEFGTVTDATLAVIILLCIGAAAVLVLRLLVLPDEPPDEGPPQ
jgi:hypothetical protein